MNYKQLLQATKEMLQAGNYADVIAEYWVKAYHLNYFTAWGLISTALDQIEAFTPQYWAVAN
jgi:hypothetical protein